MSLTNKMTLFGLGCFFLSLGVVAFDGGYGYAAVTFIVSQIWLVGAAVRAR